MDIFYRNLQSDTGESGVIRICVDVDNVHVLDVDSFKEIAR